MNDIAMMIVSCGEYHVGIWLHTTVNPTPASWAATIAPVAELKRQLGGDVSKILTMAISDGGAPNTVQRGQLFTEVLEGQTKGAAISSQLSNRLLRGIATAISWLSPNFRAFPPEQFDAALAHLGLQEHGPKLIGGFLELQKSMEPVQTLAILAGKKQ
jgi:hypothetical protein